VFWNAHSRRRSTGYFSEDFKDLFVRMVAAEPSERITIEDIAKHPWVTQPICTFHDIKEEFVVRQAKLDKIVDERRKEE